MRACDSGWRGWANLPGTRKTGLQPILLGAVLGGGFCLGRVYRLVGRFRVSTDDAYVEADTITIAPKMPGLLAMHKGKANVVLLTFLKS